MDRTGTEVGLDSDSVATGCDSAATGGSEIEIEVGSVVVATSSTSADFFPSLDVIVVVTKQCCLE